jgi:NitT/TauT family transport system permease protein
MKPHGTGAFLARERGIAMTKTNWARVFEGALVPIVVLLLWQLLCGRGISFSATPLLFDPGLGYVDPRKLPSPLAVAIRWVQYASPQAAFDSAQAGWILWPFSSELVLDSINSLYRVITGFVVGTGLALPLGLAMGASERAYAQFNPLMQVLRPIPPIAYIPLSMLWFGLGNAPAIFLIALGAFFPVLVNTIAGVRAVDSIYLRAARNLGASQSTIFRRVILPAATPYILSGVRIGIGTAFIVVIVAEMIAVNNGLGFRILEAREYFWTDKIIAGMLSIGLIGLAIDTAMNRLNNHLLRWHRGLES